ncbi:MAG TPA: threonine ammonia-lyase IlvA [Armatimonadota bacterium]|jgi:threonine dehydratase
MSTEPPSPLHAPSLANVVEAARQLVGVSRVTPVELNERLSARHGAEVYLKREDLQGVRSYKIRGAYNFMASLTEEQRERGVVCASAGNHAQGVADGCARLFIHGHIFMPKNTPRQKVSRTRDIGGQQVELHLVGDTFDAAKEAAEAFCRAKQLTFIHPFDDPAVIAGQATIGLEILQEVPDVDAIVVPIGGGGLAAGIGVVLKGQERPVLLFGAEPAGSPSMQLALQEGHPVTLEEMDPFVDGAAVRRAGDLTLSLCRDALEDLVLVPEGRICTEMIALYQRDGVIAEPAGALAVAALDQLTPRLGGQKVVCVVSGGNNDLARYSEVVERSLIYEGLRHYFVINFSQRAGSLRRYIDEALGETDDIIRFEYLKRTTREFGPALVGIELARRDDYEPLMERMRALGLSFSELTPESPAYALLV